MAQIFPRHRGAAQQGPAPRLFGIDWHLSQGLPGSGKGGRMWREISPRSNWRGWLAAVGILLVLAVFQFLERIQ